MDKQILDKNNNILLIAMVAIVGIVALTILMMNSSSRCAVLEANAGGQAILTTPTYKPALGEPITSSLSAWIWGYTCRDENGVLYMGECEMPMDANAQTNECLDIAFEFNGNCNWHSSYLE